MIGQTPYKHYPYRFKTRKEFEDEYNGSEWYWRIAEGGEVNGMWGWASPGMDYLFGTVLTVDFPDTRNDITITNNCTSCGVWYISRRMLVKNTPTIPNYKPRKIIREI